MPTALDNRDAAYMLNASDGVMALTRGHAWNRSGHRGTLGVSQHPGLGGRSGFAEEAALHIGVAEGSWLAKRSAKLLSFSKELLTYARQSGVVPAAPSHGGRPCQAYPSTCRFAGSTTRLFCTAAEAEGRRINRLRLPRNSTASAWKAEQAALDIHEAGAVSLKR